MLNRSKGPAVHGPRVQADRTLYAKAVRDLVHNSGVVLIEGEAAELIISLGKVRRVGMAGGGVFEARSVVVTTGTFLNAVIHLGEDSKAAGRAGEGVSRRLGDQLREVGLAQGRLKTGTPPRLDGRTIDWSRLEEQPSDNDAWLMSSVHEGVRLPQLRCSITRTASRTHDIIRKAEHRSPLYSGAIEGRGPRYCPSIEDKVRRFGDREGHQVFLEPEGLSTSIVYPNGISTSLPVDVQLELLHSIAGLERVRMAQPGYAVEYEHVDPRNLDSQLQAREIAGLFLAGQINGTTGYEEAASQGLVAGMNAAAFSRGLAPVLFDRRSSYIGVMIDDLIIQGVTEPYRMMTARAENRLALRADNAVARLGRAALESGGISVRRRRAIESHLEHRATAAFAQSEEGKADALYAPYVARQEREWDAIRTARSTAIGADLDFGAIPGMSNEMAERLALARPDNMDQASRVSGISPAALAALHFAVARKAA
jgi:tRNA uridine 5-carboxymethylaminomethyl modification enzyme